MPPLLLLLTFLLPPEAGTGDHLGGHEAKPHSRPYMAFVSFLVGKKRKRCDGVLVQEEFVLTAAHCKGSSVKVTLGAHNIKKPEKTQQVTFVTKAIAHPDYDCNTLFNDIMLLQGDSGAPLVCNNMVQGIFSGGKEHGRPPGVFTKVSHFLPWVKSTTKHF
ncbi:granzyme H isoform X2 [Heterocephalus glaber]|uniref:Granzyme H isoform X2 n=1 Tax=Heterocephalus glaber TaxID=10181 RepID=A0AAX6RS04_HETGA|nr:granzyme H isoform X2 [Heterocephalus glaber]